MEQTSVPTIDVDDAALLGKLCLQVWHTWPQHI
jgi:hypothetical protein